MKLFRAHIIFILLLFVSSCVISYKEDNIIDAVQITYNKKIHKNKIIYISKLDNFSDTYPVNTYFIEPMDSDFITNAIANFIENGYSNKVIVSDKSQSLDESLIDAKNNKADYLIYLKTSIGGRNADISNAIVRIYAVNLLNSSMISISDIIINNKYDSVFIYYIFGVFANNRTTIPNDTDRFNVQLKRWAETIFIENAGKN